MSRHRRDDRGGFFCAYLNKWTQSRVIVEYSGMDMDEQKRYMNLSLDAPRSMPSDYKTRDELLASMDEYIKECESQEGLCRLAKYEHESNTEVTK